MNSREASFQVVQFDPAAVEEFVHRRLGDSVADSNRVEQLRPRGDRPGKAFAAPHPHHPWAFLEPQTGVHMHDHIDSPARRNRGVVLRVRCPEERGGQRQAVITEHESDEVVLAVAGLRVLVVDLDLDAEDQPIEAVSRGVQIADHRPDDVRRPEVSAALRLFGRRERFAQPLLRVALRAILAPFREQKFQHLSPPSRMLLPETPTFLTEGASPLD